MYSGILAKTVTIFISIAIETLSLRRNLNNVQSCYTEHHKI